MINLSKAFDTVDHKILLQKLENYGLRGSVLKWFTSYLENRKQFVYLNNSCSRNLKVTCGGPNGSILGPLLFILYINDMVNCSKLLKFILFADDTSIFFSDKIHKFVFDTLNKELDNLSVLFKINNLSPNVKKTNYIAFGGGNIMNNNNELFIHNNVITKVKSSHFFGIIIDEKHKWQEHINWMIYINSQFSKRELYVL